MDIESERVLNYTDSDLLGITGHGWNSCMPIKTINFTFGKSRKRGSKA